MDTEQKTYEKAYDLALLEESFKKEKSAARRIRLLIGGLVLGFGVMLICILGYGMWGDAYPFVPNVTGNYEAAAKAILMEQGFQVKTETCFNDTAPEGLIISQEPAGGKRSGLSSEVFLTISLGKKGSDTLVTADAQKGPSQDLPVIAIAESETESENLPLETAEEETAAAETASENMTSETAEAETTFAETQTASENITSETAEAETSFAETEAKTIEPVVAEGIEKAETPEEEAAVRETTAAKKKASKNTGGIEVPKLKGYSYSQAVSKLRKKGLSYKYKMVDAYIGYKKVVKQSPSAGTKVKKGTVVMLYLSRY